MFGDMVLSNGKVVTVDANESIAEAVAVKFSRILAVGSNEQIKSLIGSETKVIDLKGKTIIPGLIDTHCHLSGSGLKIVRGEIDCSLEAGIISAIKINESNKNQIIIENTTIDGTANGQDATGIEINSDNCTLRKLYNQRCKTSPQHYSQ